MSSSRSNNVNDDDEDFEDDFEDEFEDDFEDLPTVYIWQFIVQKPTLDSSLVIY